MEKHAVKILTSIATAAILGLGAWIWNTQAAVTKLSQRLDQQRAVDETLSKFWRLHSWARTRINEERQARGEPIAEWPDLE